MTSVKHRHLTPIFFSFFRSFPIVQMMDLEGFNHLALLVPLIVTKFVQDVIEGTWVVIKCAWIVMKGTRMLKILLCLVKNCQDIGINLLRLWLMNDFLLSVYRIFLVGWRLHHGTPPGKFEICNFVNGSGSTCYRLLHWRLRNAVLLWAISLRQVEVLLWRMEIVQHLRLKTRLLVFLLLRLLLRQFNIRRGESIYLCYSRSYELSTF